MKKLHKKINTLYKIFVFFIVFSFVASPLYALELNSANFRVINSIFDSGSTINSTNFSVTGSISQPSAGSWASASLPLVAGTITSCGKIISAGAYTLGQSLTGITGPCFVVSADNVLIDGAGYSVTAVGGNSNYAIVATNASTGGNGYDLTVNNINFINFSGGINASGSNNPSGLGGNGGAISVSSSSLATIVSSGGNGSIISNNGNGGFVSISNTTTGSVTVDGAIKGSISIIGVDLNISNNSYTAGTFNLSYSGVLNTTNSSLSALTHFIINSVDLGSYIGGSFPLIPGEINSCGTIYFEGDYLF